MRDPWYGQTICRNCGEWYRAPQPDLDPFCPDCMALLAPRFNASLYDANSKAWADWRTGETLRTIRALRYEESTCPSCGKVVCTGEQPDCKALRRRA